MTKATVIALGALVLAAIVLLLGCSEYDPARGLNPNLSVRGDSAEVFLFSDPPSTARVMAVEGALIPVDEVQTPETLILRPGDYVVHFSQPGFTDALEGILLGPGEFEAVSVELDSIRTQPIESPPSVSISVAPDRIDAGASVSVTVHSDGDVGLLLPIGIFTVEGTYSDVPDHDGTVVYSFAAFRGGRWGWAADSVFVLPAPPADPDQGQVLVFSNPPSNVEMFEISASGQLVPTGMTARTPFTVEHAPGALAFTFREPGYLETTRAVLLGAGQLMEINVDLAPVGSPAAPPTIDLTVEPSEVDPGTQVTYTVRTTGADYSILFGQETQASTASEWTWTTVPDHTRITSALAFGPGGVASDSVLVVVRARPGEPECHPVRLATLRGVTTREPRVRLHPEPIRIPEHGGPLRIRLRNQYSGDVPGQEDEAFAVGLARGGEIRWAQRPSDACPVIPDPGYRVQTTVWVDCGEVDVPPGDYDVVMWHVSTGEFPCYRPVGDLRSPNSVNVEDGEVIVCQ